ncbi:hypothetical protein AJ79_01405 [Helicocarpus griseus UAMH5409]|uniref:DUF8021 domain-containing protein n=1 Tax=Helicocarpus griseus UAMH5409 TaxID=1447875 RepID=A0A2B7Y7I6_9EURO|nr:hypothetical protein AJ79_01405 [Helicocarpus griseus UAMH5409]
MLHPICTYLLLGLIIALTPLTTAQCDRAILEEATAQFVATQTSGQISVFTALADNVEYTENFQPADINTSLLATALAIDNNRSLHDTTACATYTELIITDPAHPYVTGTQMRFTDNKVSRIDMIITDEGDWLFDAAGTLLYAQSENWDPIPEDQRDTREVIRAGGDAYLNLFNDPNVEVPRYVIDETMGTVDVFLNFGGENGLPDSHEFRLEGGKLRYVHTLTVMA